MESTKTIELLSPIIATQFHSSLCTRFGKICCRFLISFKNRASAQNLRQARGQHTRVPKNFDLDNKSPKQNVDEAKYEPEKALKERKGGAQNHFDGVVLLVSQNQDETDNYSAQPLMTHTGEPARGNILAHVQHNDADIW